MRRLDFMLSSAFARKEDTGSAPLVEDEAVAADEGEELAIAYNASGGD